MERINLFTRLFISMEHHYQRVENQNKENCILIKVNHLDLRSFNDEIQTDVAIIFHAVDSEPSFELRAVIHLFILIKLFLLKI